MIPSSSADQSASVCSVPSGMMLGSPGPLEVSQRAWLDPACRHPDKSSSTATSPGRRGMAAGDQADGKPRKTHRQKADEIARFGGGALAQRQAAKVGMHVDGCPRCRKAGERIAVVKRALAAAATRRCLTCWVPR
jgi:hypothetical protein